MAKAPVGAGRLVQIFSYFSYRGGDAGLGKEQVAYLCPGDLRITKVGVPENEMQLASLPALFPAPHDLRRDQRVALRLELVALEYRSGCICPVPRVNRHG